MKWCSHEMMCTIVINVYLLPIEIKLVFFVIKKTGPISYVVSPYEICSLTLRMFPTFSQNLILSATVVNFCTTGWRHVVTFFFF